MAAPVFRIIQGSEQHKFLECRAPVAGYTGGFGNGKTSVGVVQAIRIAAEYRGARCLVGRATRPKLWDSTIPETLKWMPKEWIARMPSERFPNLEFKETGSRIEFRHVRQEGKGKGEEQSNLLSATYDFIFVDQMDDPEFGYKDFEDLNGRLRGTATYIGNDKGMPQVGPQWLRFAANPTRNWLYRELVGPYFTYVKTGIVSSKLLRYHDTNEVIIQVFNAPSKANQRNTGKDYVRRMEAAMRGSKKKRYVDGNWEAYEGQVYPEYDNAVHMVQHEQLAKWIKDALIRDELGVVEAYDYGQASPSCYGLGFYDEIGNVMLVDGFYEPNMLVSRQAKEIKRIRRRWDILPSEPIFADPDIFRSKHAQKQQVAEPISKMFEDEGIRMQRGDNNIDGGIQKFSSYLTIEEHHRNPITGNYGAPRFYVSSECEWFDNEIVDYYWNRNTQGEHVDKPRDANDHAMDMSRYMLTKRPKVIGVMRQPRRRMLNPVAFEWTEVEDDQRGRVPARYR